MRQQAALVLKDGTVFLGESFGAAGSTHGEVVFNTAMSGYEEVLTDPSYHKQIVVMTAPEIGNYGITLEDEESIGGPKVAGFIVREYNAPSSHRSKLALDDYLTRGGVCAVTGIDTRKLTLHLRTHGAQPGLIQTEPFDLDAMKKQAAALEPMDHQNLAAEVTTLSAYSVGRTDAKRHVVLIDFGAKQNIAHLLATRDCRVSVVPSASKPEAILALAPDGIMLSNGPGDPSSMGEEIALVKGLLGKVPLFGICLGHQLLGLAVGGKTFKMKFGHRGGNQPVMDLRTKQIAITSQNHGFCVDPASLPKGAETTHINLSDGTLEGFSVPHLRAKAVQFHPEASPGPHDASVLFDEFVQMMEK
jgi:carbamoyl-phosphate synthase small subunit